MLPLRTKTRCVFRAYSRSPPLGEISLPPSSQVGAGRSSPGPFRGGPPPPVIPDDSRHPPSHTPLAPMDVDRPPPLHARDYPPSSSRDAIPSSRGPIGHQSLLLHHPVSQQQIPAEEIRNSSHVLYQESVILHAPAADRVHVSTFAQQPHPLAASAAVLVVPVFFKRAAEWSRSSSTLASPSPPPQKIRTGEPPEMEWERRAPAGEHGHDWHPRARGAPLPTFRFCEPTSRPQPS